ncbi:gamma-glutamyl-gamma-aminobutyrate hydrolase family protein [Mesorhizobium sp. M0106]|uniref:gamma-glutamyl-gamma-aminobutyrate hydrolase family protein n=1 Tax=Mesorhizobium sp. M0106 TaxID=2956880 RepID=UPI003337B899
MTELYGAAPRPAFQQFIPEHDTLRIRPSRSVRNRSMPILGMCRRMQLLNVVARGSVYPILS